MNTNSRNVTYSTVGDYQLPNLTLNQPRKPLGKCEVFFGFAKLIEEPEEKQTFDRLLEMAEKLAAKH